MLLVFNVTVKSGKCDILLKKNKFATLHLVWYLGISRWCGQFESLLCDLSVLMSYNSHTAHVQLSTYQSILPLVKIVKWLL